MTRFLKGTDRPLAEAYQLALLDLDGVVYRGKNPVEYAADSIRAAEAAGMTIEYTTNNSSRFQHVVADQLKGFGLDVSRGRSSPLRWWPPVWWPRRCPPARAYRYWAPSICAMRSPATA